ncbi:MAG: UDP-N-acetylenolpyruvoylglucosamine reductase [Nitrospirae bacterium]|nr:UDP-N-acetylenolpyruvoylglucosamine reductase [Nitrospirota bacterium]
MRGRDTEYIAVEKGKGGMTGQQIRDIVTDCVFEGDMKFREPMSRHTSLKIGGPSDIFAIPENVASLGRLRDYLQKNDIAVFPLGGGTNILVKDGGIEGAVICFRSFRTIEFLGEDGEYAYLSVGTGTVLQRLVMYSMEQGYAGLEGLAGIPGTVGGAICGNAGSFGYEIKDVLVSVDLMGAEGQIQKVCAEDIRFGYRKSDILPTDMLIRAEIKLGRDKRADVSARFENFLRVKREKQPIWESSAGCVFKNPEGLSAGKLIDEAGCKGMRIGDVVVSTIHANFFINTGKACAVDFIRLMHEVAGRVRNAFGITLEPEIKIVGRENGNR